MNERKTIGEWTADYNLTKLASRVDVTKSTMHRWAIGKTLPTGEHLMKLAEALRIEPHQIIIAKEKTARTTTSSPSCAHL